MNFTLDEKAIGDYVAPLLNCFLKDCMTTAKMIGGAILVLHGAEAGCSSCYIRKPTTLHI